eukprot:TRINITY_DN14367_c0_g4_i1.p1 TRINITY_DN14367_c0_g4~~TRINITY_DN14367_c0_g4_i1.p1  ORF type:complete len:538 (+),score=61.99 TRINITY_DN14367_c0_g4_i1:44-1657(+)
MNNDPYSVLCIGRSASDAEVRSAYRRRALETHPDKGGTAQAFRHVVQAFEILGDSVRRAAFEQGAPHVGQPANAGQKGNAKRKQPEDEPAAPDAEGRVPTANAANESPGGTPIVVARLVQELFNLVQTSWSERLNKLPDATLVELETFLRVGSRVEGNGAGEEKEHDNDVEQSHANNCVADDTNFLQENTATMLALTRWDDEDVESAESDSEIVSCDDKLTQVAHMAASKATEVVGAAASQSVVDCASAAATRATSDRATASIDGATCAGATAASRPRRLRCPPRRGKTQFSGISKTPQNRYDVSVGIANVCLRSSLCRDLTTAIDVHISLVRYRQIIITRMQEGIDFPQALREVDALVTAERNLSQKQDSRISYRVRSLPAVDGRGSIPGKQTRNVEEAIATWNVGHKERISRFTRNAIEHRHRRSRQKLLSCVRRVLGSRRRRREQALLEKWGVRTLPDRVDHASLHQTDDCVCAILRLSDGSLRRGPARRSLKDAETDAVDLSGLQSRRGDAAACAELERRDVAAMTAYFLELT